jgi:hypothetical protein
MSTATFDLFDAVLKYRPDQARDARGRWTRDGSSASSRSDVPRKPRTSSVSYSAKRVRALAQTVKQSPKSVDLPQLSTRIKEETAGILDEVMATPEEHLEGAKDELLTAFVALGTAALMVYDVGRGALALISGVPLPIPLTLYAAAGLALVGAALVLYDAYVWARDKWGARSAKRSSNRQPAVRDLRGRGRSQPVFAG